MISAPEVAAVVVTFEPDAGLSERFTAIAKAIRPVVVVDNSISADGRRSVQMACERHGFELIANDGNLGLGAALNVAFRRLVSLGVKQAIAFDQDSVPAGGFVAALRETANTIASCAVVGANWHDAARPDVWSRHLRPHRWMPGAFERVTALRDLAPVSCVITSGSLFVLAAWHHLGGFDETLFLDLVDTDYCLRATSAGYAIGVSAAAKLLHRRGSKRAVAGLGRIWWPAFMPPLRLRYLCRNRVLLVRRHGWRMPHWLIFEMVYATKILGEIVFLEDDKRGKLGACVRGTWEGIRGERGPIRHD